MQRCERLGCAAQFKVHAASVGRPRRFCSDACSQRERRRNAPRPALLPPLPPPAGWYPPPTTRPAWPPTPTLTRREALERWAEIVAAANAPHRAARTIHETDAHETGGTIQSAHGHEALPRRTPTESVTGATAHSTASTNNSQPTNTPKTGQKETKT